MLVTLIVVIGTVAAIVAGAVAPSLPVLHRLADTPRRALAAFSVAVLTIVVAVILQAVLSDEGDKKVFAAAAAGDVTTIGGTLSCGTVGENRSVTGRWGPERPTYTLDNPAPEATLNSITDNPNEGDERTFFEVKDATHTKSAGFCGSRRVSDGQVLLLRTYVENSASDNLAGTHEGTARDVTLLIDDNTVASTLRRVTATLASSTTAPAEIYSMVELTSDRPFRIDPVVGSGRVYGSRHPKGRPLPTDPWERPVLLGINELNGVIEPGYQFSLVVTFEVRVTHLA